MMNNSVRKKTFRMLLVVDLHSCLVRVFMGVIIVM